MSYIIQAAIGRLTGIGTGIWSFFGRTKYCSSEISRNTQKKGSRKESDSGTEPKLMQQLQATDNPPVNVKRAHQTKAKTIWV